MLRFRAVIISPRSHSKQTTELVRMRPLSIVSCLPLPRNEVLESLGSQDKEWLPGMVAHSHKPNRFQASLGCTSGPWLKITKEMKRYKLA